jgi:hypothetical protein
MVDFNNLSKVNKTTQRNINQETQDLTFENVQNKIPFFDPEKTPDGIYIITKICPSRGKNKGYRMVSDEWQFWADSESPIAERLRNAFYRYNPIYYRVVRSEGIPKMFFPSVIDESEELSYKLDNKLQDYEANFCPSIFTNDGNKISLCPINEEK